MSRPKILVVDDEPSVLRLVSNSLSARGYEVHAAGSPVQALDLVKTTPSFDLVVSDIIMPEICGPELIRRIKQMCPNIAVILMSAHIASEALPEHAAFLSKPFQMADLFSVVERKLTPPLGDSTSA